MVTKKRTAKRRASAPRKAARRVYRRKKSDISYIPAAAATVGVVVANLDNLKKDYNFIKTHPIGTKLTSNGKEYILNAWQKYIEPSNLVKSAIGYGAGYVGGEIAKKYAPGVLKRPMGKIAKKIPRM